MPSLIMYERVDFVAAELLASLQEIEFQDEPQASHFCPVAFPPIRRLLRRFPRLPARRQ